MRNLLSLIGLLALLVFAVPVGGTADPASVTIRFLNPPDGGLLELAVGESYTFEVEVSSSEPFILAMATVDQDYPGRGVFFHGNDTAHRGTSAVLYLTITGKQPTDLLPEGVAPMAIVAGVRYQGGIVYSERCGLNVLVTP